MENTQKKSFDNNYQNQTNETEDREIVIPVIQEEAYIDKKVVESGKVRIKKTVNQYEELIDEPLLREEVKVERVSINQYVDQMPQARQEGDTLIIPVVKEEVVIQKRLLLVEELHVQKQIIETHEPQNITLHKEEVEVVRIAADEI